jgi:hypothetical protein
MFMLYLNLGVFLWLILIIVVIFFDFLLLFWFLIFFSFVDLYYLVIILVVFRLEVLKAGQVKFWSNKILDHILTLGIELLMTLLRHIKTKSLFTYVIDT